MISGLFSALGTLIAWIGHVVDPLCGPAGVLTWFGGTSILSCGDSGWGDDISFGVKVTISLAIATLPVGLTLGFLVALGNQSKDRVLRLSSGIYTTIFRGLPELLTLFIIYYGLQFLIQSALASMGLEQRIEINSFFAGMIALSVVFSSYCSEVLQSAFKAIPQGQYEAGHALGLSSGKTMLLIILPQLIRIALPGLVNLWMNLLKDTALVSVIGLSEIMRQTGIAAKVTKEAFFFYLFACALYLVLALVSSIGIGFIDRRIRKSEAPR